MHHQVPDVPSIAAISYILVQLSEHFISCQFCTTPHAMILLQVNQFALLPAMAILCVLEITPWRIRELESENLQISVSDTNHFDKLVRQTQNIKSTIKNMNSRPLL